MPAPVFGILGQAAPAAGVTADVYAVPNARRAVASVIVIANTSGADTTYRLHARPNAAATAVGNAIAYDVAIKAGETHFAGRGLALGDLDVVSGRSVGGGVTFTVTGEESDPATA